MKNSQQDHLEKASSMLRWSKLVVSILEMRSPLFVLLFIFYCYNVLTFFEVLYRRITEIDLVLMILAGIFTCTHSGIRFYLLRKHNRTFSHLLNWIQKDYVDGKVFTSDSEIRVFLKYNRLAGKLIRIMGIIPMLAAVLYYLKPLMIQYENSRTVNGTVGLRDPIHGEELSMLEYVFQFPFAFMSGSIPAAADCMIITLGCHLSARFCALSQRLRVLNRAPANILADELMKVIKIHQQLLKVGKKIEISLSHFMLAHLIISSLQIGVMAVELIQSMAPGNRDNLVSVFVLLMNAILRFYVHSLVGEFLINESSEISEAFYDFNWFDISTQNKKIIMFAIARGRNPVCLSTIGFGNFSIQRFSEVVTRAMAYISFIRKFI